MRQAYEVGQNPLPLGFHLFLDGKDVTMAVRATEFDEEGDGWVSLLPYEREEDGRVTVLSHVSETRYGKVELRKVE